MDLLKDFQDNWKRKGFHNQQLGTLLAVSGGVDSMVMADLFLKSGLAFGIAHCNFQLRGEASELDEQLVKDWAAKNNVPFFHTRFETKQMTEEWKKGVQETARILRYEWLDSVCKEHGYGKIATAHHANDNVETLLMNLFKGTGISGLHGILENTDKIIRPLLFAQKEDIRAYAATNGVQFREDASNETDTYLRNSVRLNILPVIEQSFPNVVTQVNDSISRFAQAEQLYRKAVDAELKKLVELRGNDLYIPIRKLKYRKPLETIAYELFQPYGFSPAQIPQILQLMESESGHYVASATNRVIRNRDFLIVTNLPTEATDFILVEGTPATIHTTDGTMHFTIEKKPKEFVNDSSIAYIDLKQVEFPLILRRWKKGDYFYPLGMKMKKKKLSKFFIEQKLAIHQKEQVWVVECQKRIVWVAGMRMDERFKVKDNTEQVLTVSLSR